MKPTNCSVALDFSCDFYFGKFIDTKLFNNHTPQSWYCLSYPEFALITLLSV